MAPSAKPAAKAAAKPKLLDKPRPVGKVAVAKPPAKVAFPKKARPPSHAEFAARLPAAVGKRFDGVRAFLTKQGVAEDFYYYGPRTGWAYRYLQGEQSLCSIMIQADRLIGIVALDAGAQAKVAWGELSDVARRARRMAHGTPALLWLDIPLDGPGAADFRRLLKAKLSRDSAPH
jgi:hypothetical protein